MTEKLTNTFTFNYKYTHCRDCYSKLVELLWSRELFHFNCCSWQWIAMNAPISDVEDKRRSSHPLTTWKPHSMLCYFFELPVQITNWDRVLYHHITKNSSSLKILETSNINHSHTPRVARNNSIASEQTMLHVSRIKDGLSDLSRRRRYSRIYLTKQMVFVNHTASMFVIQKATEQ